MTNKLAKYIPQDMRLEIAQSVIENNGIRPLARKIDVNPKSVYKYKNGTSHPGDEIMAKILEIADRDDSVPLDKYLEKLHDEFTNALESPLELEENPEVEEEEPVAGEVESGPGEVEEKEEEAEETVGSESTEEVDKARTVGVESTESLTNEKIYQKIGVTSPFNQTKVRKILEALTTDQQLSISEIVELTGLSEDAIEKYLEKMTNQELVTEVSDNTFSLRIEIQGGE